MIKCILTDTDEYKRLVYLENQKYTLKISKKYRYWYYDLCDLMDFYANSDVRVECDINCSDMQLARKLYENHKYNECFLRDNESLVMVHSTTKQNAEGILKDNLIKSWNQLNTEKHDCYYKPIGYLLGDIPDFANYVMLSDFYENNEIVTASKNKGVINTDINQRYCAGARFYLDAKKLAENGLLLRDGAHVKVRDYIDLNEYLIWYSTPDKLGINENTTPKEFFYLSNTRFIKMFE